VAGENAADRLEAMINKIMDDRDARKAIENDPKAAGAELGKDLREFLIEWKASKAARGNKPAAKPGKSDDDDGNVLSALFGG
jgi:hypothetical protein